MRKKASYPSFRLVRYRFRRWCRKGYAAFASLSRAVTIGCLAAHVSERFQTKYTTLHRSGLHPAAEKTTIDEEEEKAKQAAFPLLAAGNGFGYPVGAAMGVRLYGDDCACRFFPSLRSVLSIKKAEDSRFQPGSLPLFYWFPGFYRLLPSRPFGKSQPKGGQNPTFRVPHKITHRSTI